MHSASITNKVVKSFLCIREFWGGDLHAQSQTVSVCFVFGIQACLPYHRGQLKRAIYLREENQQPLSGIKRLQSNVSLHKEKVCSGLV